MPNWLSLTCENDRVMLLSARVHGGTAVFDRSFSYSLKPEASTESGGIVTGVPKSLKRGELAELIQKHRLTKAETVVVLGRGDVEVRPMVFPPVPIDELPDLVRFQAAKEFNAYDPSSPLDFVITNKLENVSRSTLFPAIRTKGKTAVQDTSASTDGPKHLLASTIRSETLRKIQQLCEDLNLNLRRVVLRPCEVAFLWRRSPEFDPGRTYLFVELDVAETPQSVLHHGQPVFMRSPKIGGSDDMSSPEFAAKLLAELKRTRIAVRNEVQGVTIDEVILCGTGTRFEKLKKPLEEGLGVPVSTFDPWHNVQRGDELKRQLPEAPERFASLIGATLQAARGEASAIDFCNPKKRPEPIGQRQLLTGIVAAVLFLVIVVIGYGLYARSRLTTEISELNKKVKSLQSTSAGVAKQRDQLAEIDNWLADNVNWFEQLEWLSRNSPGSRDMILNKLTLTANKGGSMTLETLVKDSSVFAPMEEKLRDDGHLIKPAEKGEQKGSPFYTYRYNLSIFLTKAAAVAEITETSPSKTESPATNETSKPETPAATPPNTTTPVAPSANATTPAVLSPVNVPTPTLPSSSTVPPVASPTVIPHVPSEQVPPSVQPLPNEEEEEEEE